MKAIIVNDDKSLAWSEVEEPEVREGEVKIEVYCAACNRADVLQRAGKYPSPEGWVDRMGLEVSGVVIESRFENFKKGDRVCALLGGGGYSELVCCPGELVMPMPHGMSFEVAAAIPETFATAHLNLVGEAGIKSGDTVLVIAGASGLGSAAIQIAKHYGAKVITTVGSDDKAQFVKNLGADITVNRKTGDLGKIMDENPVDIALDCAAGCDFGKNFLKMNRGGRWIIVSTLAGEVSEINLRGVMKKGLKLIGSTLRSRTNEVKGRILKEMVEEYWTDFETGKMKPQVSEVFPITEADKAHDFLNNAHVGKAVLKI